MGCQFLYIGGLTMLLLLNLVIFSVAAALVCYTVLGDSAKVSYTHQIKRVANALLVFASQPEDSQSRNTLIIWIAGFVLCLLLLSGYIGIGISLLGGAFVGKWISIEPIAPPAEVAPSTL